MINSIFWYVLSYCHLWHFLFDSVLIALTIPAGFVAHSIGTIITAFIQWFIFISSGHACFNVGWAFKQRLNLKTDVYLLNLVSHDFWRQIITLFSCKSQIGTCSCHSNHSENNFKAPPSLWMQENFYGWEHITANIFLWISCFRTIPRNTRFLCFSGPSNYCIYLRATDRHFCDQGNVCHPLKVTKMWLITLKHYLLEPFFDFCCRGGISCCHYFQNFRF